MKRVLRVSRVAEMAQDVGIVLRRGVVVSFGVQRALRMPQDVVEPAGRVFGRLDAARHDLPGGIDGVAEVSIHIEDVVGGTCERRLLGVHHLRGRPGGELRLVANSFLKYPPLIEQHLGPCRSLAEGDGFRIYSARRP